MNRPADLNENGYLTSQRGRIVNIPRVSIRTPVRWYILSPAFSLAPDDENCLSCRHCDDRGCRRQDGAVGGLTDEKGL